MQNTASLNVLGSSVSWVAQLLTGTLATAISMLAVAGVGFALMQGRLPIRKGGAVILGCAIVFSARPLAEGILGAGKTDQSTPVYDSLPSPAYIASAPEPVPFDPYAGASVPQWPGGERGSVFRD
ncbi:TrbC/VirB2 family protein [Sphingomonas sp. 3-13AW]|uniref:TrbC/VirB2 family protein n=1 Tax=Sphingomonas sp. 3-13AW TaxID=3050450 RepID=UPI003BB63DFB